MIDESFIRHSYAVLTDQQLIALVKKDGNGLTKQALEILREEFIKRNLNPAVVEAIEQNKQFKQKQVAERIRSGQADDAVKMLWHNALFEMKNGKTYNEIFESLLKEEVDEQLALEITEGLEIRADSLVKKDRKKIATGGAVFIIGLSITLISLANPVSGMSIIAYGAILSGLAAFASGFTGIGSHKKILANCIKQRQAMKAAEKLTADED